MRPDSFGHLLPALTAIIALMGCSSHPSAPTTDQARSLIAGQLGEFGVLSDFRKINGESQVRSGQPFYVLHYRAAVTLPAGHTWYTMSGHGGLKDQFYGYGAKTRLPAGTTYATQGTITFRKTENGWEGTKDDIDMTEHGYCTDKQAQLCYDFLWPGAPPT
jgi:hypothetical protein